MTATLQPVRDADAELESRIIAALDASQNAQKAGDGVTASEKWAEFVALLAQRSPAKVEQMEREKGLR